MMDDDFFIMEFDDQNMFHRRKECRTTKDFRLGGLKAALKRRGCGGRVPPTHSSTPGPNLRAASGLLNFFPESRAKFLKFGCVVDA